MIETEIKITPELAAEHGLTAEEYARIQKILGRDPNLHRARHLQRDVERALLLQIEQSASAPPADARAAGAAGPRRKRGRRGHRRRPRRRLQDGVAQSSELRRAVSGRGHGRRRNSARHFHDGRAADRRARFAALRPAQPAKARACPPEEAARNRRILDGVVRRHRHYGNCFGVPTVGGEVQFEPGYSANPLVNVLALGIARREDLFFAHARGVGNPVIYVGAKTGRDGIHGASLLASAEFTEESQQKRPNVQVGDPFMEKLLLEACLEAMQTGAVVAIQDMGAAGLTSSSCEMASRGGLGIEIELARVPQRETGMTPYEMMLSESQERMLLVAERGREERSLRRFRQVGTRRGRNRPRHRRWIAAHPRIMAESWPKFPRMRWPKKGRSTSGPIAPPNAPEYARPRRIRCGGRGSD